MIQAEIQVSEGRGRRVYAVDDDTHVLEVLQTILQDAGYDTHCYQNSVHFVDALSTLAPGVVITDYRMGQVDGPEVQRRLLERQNDFRMILITAYPRTSSTVSALKLGAVTVLDKPFDRRDLLQAVQEGFQQLQLAEQEDSALPPLLPGGESYLSLLSERERQVVDLVYQGNTNKGMSIQLGISIKTVEKHRAKSMRKLKVKSIAGLIRLMDRERDLHLRPPGAE